MVMEPKPEISLLMDGELDAHSVDGVAPGGRIPLRATWVCYHVIGDALRGSAAPTPGFAARGKARGQPTVLAPQPRKTAPAPMALAIAATVAAISVVGWVALSTMPSPATVTAIATARQAASVRAADARRPVDNEYLLVHQEYSPTTAIQGVRPYLRAVAASDPDARP
jgi:sigma-E factor negative regulatory protein RseA